MEFGAADAGDQHLPRRVVLDERDDAQVLAVPVRVKRDCAVDRLRRERLRLGDGADGPAVQPHPVRAVAFAVPAVPVAVVFVEHQPQLPPVALRQRAGRLRRQCRAAGGDRRRSDAHADAFGRRVRRDELAVLLRGAGLAAGALEPAAAVDEEGREAGDVVKLQPLLGGGRPERVVLDRVVGEHRHLVHVSHRLERQPARKAGRAPRRGEQFDQRQPLLRRFFRGAGGGTRQRSQQQRQREQQRAHGAPRQRQHGCVAPR